MTEIDNRNLFDELISRGYYHQSTNLEKLKETANSKQIVAYIGFDCTANSLHVGNLMQIMILRKLQQHGHKPIVLVGGATTKIGDPTGKDKMRKMLTDEDILNNMQGIKHSLSKFIRFGDGESDAIMVNNDDWIKDLNYIDFLRNYGKIFSVNKMLTMDSVRLRLEREQNLTFLEFNYMLIQAYDFYHLNKEYDCCLQIGGSDQWGNIIMGVDFARRINNQEVFGFTTPLLTTSSGAKMGKSENGAVWINEDALSAYEYFQFWRNVEDADVERFAKLYLEQNNDKFNEFKELTATNINEAKKILAFEATKLCHGLEAAEQALKTSIEVFEKGNSIEGLPEIIIDKQNIESGLAATELFLQAELVTSKSEARKLIRGGGAKLNDKKIEDEHLIVNSEYLTAENYLKLSAGKKRHLVVRVK